MVYLRPSESEFMRPFEVGGLLNSGTGTTAFHPKDGAAAIDPAQAKAPECSADGLVIVSVESKGTSVTTSCEGKAILQAMRYTGAGGAAAPTSSATR